MANDPGFIYYVKNNTSIYKSRQVLATQGLLVVCLSYIRLWLGVRDKYNIPDEGANKPAHYRLAYSYGSKQYLKRTRPPAGECKEEVYGLVCSGYVSFIFNFIGILMIEGTANDQRRTDYLQKLLQDTYSDTDKIEVIDLGKLDPTHLKTGDIIYRENSVRAYHLGLVLLGYVGSTPKFVVAHSTGSSWSNCEENYSSLKRGVCLSDLNELMDESQGKNFSRNYRIVRYSIQLIKPCGNLLTVSYGDQTYHAIEIGSQCWLKENMKVGTMITRITEQTNNSIIEKYCFGDNPANCAIYVGLYEWNEAVNYNYTERIRGI